MQLEFLHPSRFSTGSVEYKNIKFPIVTNYTSWQSLPFFQPEERNNLYNYCKITSNYDYHSKFSFKPLYLYPFDDIYEGANIDIVLDYLKSCSSFLCEKSFYMGAGKDDMFESYYRYDFKKPPNKTFFIDLLQIFDIHWIEDGHLGLTDELGKGFYKFVGRSHYYSKAREWSEVRNDKGIEEIVKWFENLKDHYPNE